MTAGPPTRCCLPFAVQVLMPEASVVGLPGRPFGVVEAGTLELVGAALDEELVPEPPGLCPLPLDTNPW